MTQQSAGAQHRPPGTDGARGSAGERADRVVQAVLAVPGVVAMHGGKLGEIGTHLPGRRVLGVRLDAAKPEVHIVIALGRPVLAIIDDVRAAAETVLQDAVLVIVQDVTTSTATITAAFGNPDQG